MDEPLPTAEEFWDCPEGRLDELCAGCGATAYSARQLGQCTGCGAPWQPGDRRATVDEMPDIGETLRARTAGIAGAREMLARFRARRAAGAAAFRPGRRRPQRGS